MQAQRDSTEPVESIVMYMQAVNHPDLAMVFQSKREVQTLGALETQAYKRCTHTHVQGSTTY